MALGKHGDTTDRVRKHSLVCGMPKLGFPSSRHLGAFGVLHREVRKERSGVLRLVTKPGLEKWALLLSSFFIVLSLTMVVWECTEVFCGRLRQCLSSQSLSSCSLRWFLMKETVHAYLYPLLTVHLGKWMHTFSREKCPGQEALLNPQDL